MIGFDTVRATLAPSRRAPRGSSDGTAVRRRHPDRIGREHGRHRRRNCGGALLDGLPALRRNRAAVGLPVGHGASSTPTAAHATATGAGVKVGVIDGGVDFTHPDLAGAIDVALSCSFIYSTTPTADPQEIANGDCSNKAAVQDLQGHGTHVATTIAGPRQRNRHRRRRAGGDDRRPEGLHDRRASASPTRSRPRSGTPATSASTW